MKTITQGQRRQIERFLTDVLEKVAMQELIDRLELNSPGAQRVIEHGNEFARTIREAALASIQDLSTTDKYKYEEIASNYEYPLSYKKPKSITEQAKILHEIFPELGSVDERLTERELPEYAEGWFAIPMWQKIAPTYAEAVLKVFEAHTARIRDFTNRRDRVITNEHLRQTAKTEEALQKLAEAQKTNGSDCGILVVAAQFGLRHRGRSARRAREIMQASEFGLGAFEVGIMILTHPERFRHDNDLWIDCPGDEFDCPTANARFSRVPVFSFSCDNEVTFSTDSFSDARRYYGSASGFLPALSASKNHLHISL